MSAERRNFPMVPNLLTGKVANSISSARDEINTDSKLPSQESPSPEQMIDAYSKALGLPPR